MTTPTENVKSPASGGMTDAVLLSYLDRWSEHWSLPVDDHRVIMAAHDQIRADDGDVTLVELHEVARRNQHDPIARLTDEEVARLVDGWRDYSAPPLSARLCREIGVEPPLPRQPRDRPPGPRYVQTAIERECDDVASTRQGGRNAQLNRSAYALARFVASGEADPHEVVRRLAAAAAHAGMKKFEIQSTIRSAFKSRGAA